MDLVTVSYSQHGEPVRRAVAAVRVGPEQVWVAEALDGDFSLWDELTPIWQSYDRTWLVVGLTGSDVVCATANTVLFPGNEHGFQLCIRRGDATLHRHNERFRTLAQFHHNRSWAWRPDLDDDPRRPWLSVAEPLTIAPARYFLPEDDKPVSAFPRLRPSLLAEHMPSALAMPDATFSV